MPLERKKDNFAEGETHHRLLCIRHGKPSIQYSKSVWHFLRSGAFNGLLDDYDRAGLDLEWNQRRISRKILIPGLSSDLPRALETAIIFTGMEKDDIPTDPIYREVPLPRFKNERLLLPAFLLITMARIGWFTGWMENTESYSDTKTRVRIAADKLEEKLQAEGELALFSHGFFLWMLNGELKRRGWQTKWRGAMQYLDIAEYIRKRI